MVDFVAAFDFLWKNDPRMNKVNPFSVDDRRKIPTFPLKPSDTEEAPEKSAQKARNPRSKVGGRILAKS
jgi:hypothetical protein